MEASTVEFRMGQKVELSPAGEAARLSVSGLTRRESTWCGTVAWISVTNDFLGIRPRGFRRIRVFRAEWFQPWHRKAQRGKVLA